MKISAHKGASRPFFDPEAKGPRKGEAREQRVLKAKAVLAGLSGAPCVPTGVTPGRQSIPLGPPATNMEDVTNRLPGGGLIKNALHEVRPLDPRDGPAATAFLLGLAARLGGGGANDAGGLIVWIRPQDVIREWGLPYAPGLAPFGLNPARCLFIYPRTEQEALWAVEEAVQSRGVRLVLAEVEGARLDLTASRRIHLTAEKVAVPALIARSGRATQATAALTRWAVGSAPSARPAYGARGIGARRWHVELERARGGRPGAFEMEWDHEAYHFRLVAPLADRSAEAGLQPANENIAVA